MHKSTSRLSILVTAILALSLAAWALPVPRPASAQSSDQSSDQSSESSDRVTITPLMVESVGGRPIPAELIRLTTVATRDGEDDAGLTQVEVPFLRFPTASSSPDAPIFVLSADLGADPVGRFSPETVLPFVAQFGRTADIVLVGIRGTGEATPRLRCAAGYDARLDEEMDPTVLAADLGAYYSTCDEFWRDQDVVSGRFNTVEIARDVDVVRNLLGYESISLIGADFGSQVVLELMRSYGNTVERAVLGALIGTDQMLYLPGGADAVLEDLNNRAALDSALSAVMPSFLTTMEAVLGQLSAQPATVSVADPATGSEFDITVGAADLQSVTVSALASGARWSLPARYYEMSQGDFTWLGESAYRLRTDIGQNLMPVAATCASGASASRRETVELEADQSLLGNAVNGIRFDLCTAVGAPDLGDDFRDSFESGVPALFISGTMDPYAQPAEVDQMVAGFENGQHLIVTGAGRNIFGEAYAQLAPIVFDFLFAGDVDSAGATVTVARRLAPIVIAPVSDIGWSAGYYNNRSVQGDPTIQRIDPAINFNWGEGSPDPAIAADNFSARWTASRELAAGPYRFSAWADDGMRVRVDDVLVIDQWEEGGARNFVTDVNLVRGLHNVEVEYFEAEGLALAQLRVAALTDFPDWKAEYFDNVAVQGEPLILRNETTIDQRWRAGAAPAGLPIENISARWTRRIPVPAGTYQVTVQIAGAVRVWLDGIPLIDDWTFGPLRSLSGQSQPLPAGEHDLRVEYAKTTGDGLISVTWTELSAPETAPSAVIAGPQRVIVGETFTLDATSSTPGSGQEILTVAWDLGDGTATTGQTIQHLYSAPGFYNVTLTVTNERGVSGTTTIQIRADGERATPPPAQPPQAVIVAPAQGIVGEPLLFDASQSTASNPIAVYGWQFGDGTNANAVQVSKTYGAAGIYNVVLTVTDADGLTSTTTRLVQIFAPTPTPTPDQPPTPTPPPPPTPDLPPTATPTFTPLPGQPTFTPIPGQPTAPIEGTPPIDFTPPPEGAVTPTPDGEPAAAPQAVIQNIYRGQILAVQIENGVAVLPDVKINQIVTLLGTDSIPGTYPITSYYWDMQDGGITSQDEAFQISFTEPGEYPVTLTVSDEVGLSGTTRQVIRVINELETP